VTAVSDEIEPGWDGLPIDPTHAVYLAGHGILPHVAAAHGVRSVMTADQLPEEFAHHGDQAVPALLYPWTEPDGAVRRQLRVPDGRIKDAHGKPAKYLWGRDAAAKLWAARPQDGAGRMLIVEGTKQTLAAASYAPEGTAVYGIGGCRMWSQDGVPTPHLAVAEGRDVIVILDADAATNLEVYNAGCALAEALTDQGARSVRFVRMGAGKKAGLDDVLGGQPHDRRGPMLANMIEKAAASGVKGARPADTKPKASAKKRAGAQEVEDDGRPTLVVNGDKLRVIRELTDALRERWSGTRLFDFGGIPTVRRGATTIPLHKDAFARLIAETARTVARSGAGEEAVDVDAWPDDRTLGAVMSEPGEFARLERISRVPYLRADGSLVQEPGYDEATCTYLMLSDDLADVKVPDEPTAQDVAAAKSLIFDDLLEGFPFPDDASRAGALALLLTPFIRGLVPLAPLAVVDGKEAGSGKNLFADAVSIVATGQACQPLPYTTDDAEQRKVITSAFRSGAELFVFDEAHKLDGPSFARALTSVTYQDRVLGVSNLVDFPNRITWMSLGNRVEVAGDMGRRCYFITLSYPGASPENRPSSDFKHPDLRDWAHENRAALVAACLTLVRSWFAAGKPWVRTDSFGSFEKWQQLLAGVLAHIGVPGFLDNVKVKRSESDFERAHWGEHLAWLRRTFGDDRFTSAQVIRALDRDPVAEHPPGLEDTSGKSYPRQLGYAYARTRDRNIDGFVLLKTDGTGHGRVTKWAIVGPDSGEQDDLFGSQGSGPNPEPTAPSSVGPEPSGSNQTAVSVGTSPAHSELTPAEPAPSVLASPKPAAAPSGSSPASDLPVAPKLVASTGRDDERTEHTAAAADRPAAPPGGDPSPDRLRDVRNDPDPGAAGRADLPLPHLPSADPAAHDAGMRTFTVPLGQGEAVIHAPRPGEFDPAVFRACFPGGALYGLDVESTALTDLGPWDPDYRLRLVQVATTGYAWVLRMDDDEQRAAVVELLSDETVSFCSHTDIDPMGALTFLGVDITQRFVDTKTLASMAAPDDKLGGKDLKTLATSWGMPQVEAGEKVLHERFREIWTGRKNAKKADVEAFGWANIPIDDPAYLVYAGLDTVAARRLADLLVPATQAPATLLRTESWLTGQAARIRARGMRVDREMLQELTDEAARETGEAEAVIKELTGGTPARSPRIQGYLAEHGVDWNAWPGAMTEGGAPSLAKENVRLLLDYPLDADGRTAAEQLIRFKGHQDMLNKTKGVWEHLTPDGRVHPVLNTIGAVTGRMSSAGPNFQNFSKKDPRMRGCLIPDDGNILLTADFDQIELRVVAALAGEQKMIEVILAGGDLHQLTVDELAAMDIEITRDVGKMTGFLVVYGGGGKALSQQANIPLEAAQQIVSGYRERYPAIADLTRELAQFRDSIRTVSRRRIPVKRWASGDLASYANINYEVQSSSRDLLVDAWFYFAAELGYADAVWYPVHDELVLEVPEERVEEMTAAIETAMRFDFLGVPISASAVPLIDEHGVSRWMTSKQAEKNAAAKAAV
jgi:DNA polymerase I-like protein with 3'-5' exonuclease and polymerase domains